MSDDQYEIHEHYEQLGDFELYFADTGPKDAPAIVFLHGGPGYNSYSFQDLMGEYLEDHRLVYLDQRGSGRSQEPSPDLQHFTVDALVSDLCQVRDFLDLDSITPLGHGFGAVIGLEYARQNPKRCEQVVAVNPWLHFPELSQVLLKEAMRITNNPTDTNEDDEPEDRIERAFEMLNARDLLNALHFKDAKSRMRLEFSDTESGLLAGGLLQEGLVSNGLWKLEYPLYLEDIKTPIAVIAGSHDRSSYPSQTDWLVDLSGASLQVLNAGHYPWLDDPDAFLAALRKALGHYEN